MKFQGKKPAFQVTFQGGVVGGHIYRDNFNVLSTANYPNDLPSERLSFDGAWNTTTIVTASGLQIMGGLPSLGRRQ
uniref:Uncharacterized protein n=1 Tax=Salix viminalis TaxID=40686 RepID=A0A6N2NL95_SALVM